MKHAALGDRVSRRALIDWYRAGRARSHEIFSIPIEDAYYERPIALRNPIVFYEGHIPAFAVNTLIKLALREEGIDERYEVLFARGIDPHSEDAVKNPIDLWPKQKEPVVVHKHDWTVISSIPRTSRAIKKKQRSARA